MRNTTVYYFVTVYLIICGFTTTCSSAIGSSELELMDLKDLLSKSYASSLSIMKNVKITFELKARTDPNWLKQFKPNPVEYFSNSYEYIQKNSRERLTSYTGTSADEDITRPFAVSDGQYILEYWPTKGTGDTKTQRGRAVKYSRDTGLFYGVGVGVAPSRLFGYEHGCMPDDVLGSSELKLSTQAEIINGVLSYKATAPITINSVIYDVSYWLSPEHSGLPVRMELREVNGVLKKVQEVKEFIEVSDGLWLPKKVYHRAFKMKDGEPWEIGTDIYTITTVELQPSIDEETVLSTLPNTLPVGALLRDSISGLEYVIGEGPISDERIKKIIEEALFKMPMEDEFLNSEDTYSPPNQKRLDEGTEPNEASGNPLFSDTGVLTSETTTRPHPSDENKTSVLVWALIVICTTVIVGIAVLKFRKLTVKMEKKVSG